MKSKWCISLTSAIRGYFIEVIQHNSKCKCPYIYTYLYTFAKCFLILAMALRFVKDILIDRHRLELGKEERE